MFGQPCRDVIGDTDAKMLGMETFEDIGATAFAHFAAREPGVACRAVAREASEGWWSQAGSNRRPHHCERCALPAELWPRTRRPKRKGGSQSAPFTIRTTVKSRTVKNGRFLASLAALFPCLAGGEPISSTLQIRITRVHQPCVQSSTSFLSFSISTSGC
jgi:hypothetical protein